MDVEKCRIEWNFVKELVFREHYPVGFIAELWKMLATHHGDEVQNLIIISFFKSHLYCQLIQLAVKEVLVHRIKLRML